MPDVRQRRKGAEEADASTSAAASSGPAPVARAKPRVPRLGRAVLWTGCFYIFMFAFVWAFCALAPRSPALSTPGAHDRRARVASADIVSEIVVPMLEDWDDDRGE